MAGGGRGGQVTDAVVVVEEVGVTDGLAEGGTDVEPRGGTP